MTRESAIFSLVLIHLMSLGLMFVSLMSLFIGDISLLKLNIYFVIGALCWYLSFLRIIHISSRGDSDE